MRQIVINIDAGEKTCRKCEMQMLWKSAADVYVDCVLTGDTIAKGKAKPRRTALCLASEKETT